MSDDRLIIDSEASWRVQTLVGPWRTERELKIAMQGMVLRAAWGLDGMARGGGGLEDGAIQPLRMTAASTEAIRKTISPLLFAIREAQVVRNPAFDAHTDPAVQKLIADAMNPAPKAKKGKRKATRRKP
jgi:hypothetical protein